MKDEEIKTTRSIERIHEDIEWNLKCFIEYFKKMSYNEFIEFVEEKNLFVGPIMDKDKIYTLKLQVIEEKF